MSRAAMNLSRGAALWIANVQAFLKSKALERREHAIATWGDTQTTEAWRPRPDDLYRFVGRAWRPGR